MNDSSDRAPDLRISAVRTGVFVVLTLFLHLAAAEFLLRAFYTPPPEVEFTPFLNPEWESRDVYERDPSVFWKFHPSQTIHVSSPVYGEFDISINNQGFSGEDWPRPHSTEDHLRILLLGDSCVFGWGAEVGQRLADHLVHILEGDGGLGRPVDVMSAGTPGYSSQQILQLLREWAPTYKPHWVVVWVGTNDALPAVFEDDLALTRSAVSAFLEQTAGELFLVRLVSNFYSTWTEDAEAKSAAVERAKKFPQDGPRRVPLDRFESNLREIHRIARKSSAQTLLVTRQNLYPNPVLDGYNDMIRGLAAESNLPLVDAAGAFLEHASAEVYANVDHDPVHPNGEGYRVVAKLIAEVILAEIDD